MNYISIKAVKKKGYKYVLHKCWASGWDPAGSPQIRLALAHSRWLLLVILVPV